MIFAITTLISALSISLIAAYFSIIGLATIFPGSMYAVIAMGSVLEVGKIIASIWLHRNWKSAPRLIKFYLFSAILVLMGITSMGIFGFLSKSHIEHEQTAEKSKALVAQIENKIERKNEYIKRQKELIQKKEVSSENLGDKTAENIKIEQEKIEQLSSQLEKDIEIDNKIIASLNNRLSQLNEDLDKIKNKSNIFIAYEPVWAIGTGIVPNSKNLLKTIKFIKNKFKGKPPKVLYGGSVNPQNIIDLKEINNIDGFLIGGASQNSKKFIDIVKKTYS